MGDSPRVFISCSYDVHREKVLRLAELLRADGVETHLDQYVNGTPAEASGSHKRWEQERPEGRIVVKELHKYPASRGRVLRHIGEQLELAVELVAAYRLGEIVASMKAP